MIGTLALVLLEQRLRFKEAKDVLRRIYESVSEEPPPSYVADTSSSKRRDLWSVFRDPRMRLALFVASVLSAGQQLSGINVFVTLSNQLFKDAGVPEAHLTTASTIMSVVNAVRNPNDRQLRAQAMTIPAIIAVETLGRKKLMVIGAREKLVAFDVRDAGGFGQALCLCIVPISPC
eukprot:Polyplicarium_translucidae@DN5199_c0_g1_i1.p1